MGFADYLRLLLDEPQLTRLGACAPRARLVPYPTRCEAFAAARIETRLESWIRRFAVDGKTPQPADFSAADYAASEAILTDPPSPWLLPLAGEWQLRYYRIWDELSGDFSWDGRRLGIREGLDWNRVRVPHQLELDGYGSPRYINQRYDWADGVDHLHVPTIPDEEYRAAVYRRVVKVPDGMCIEGLLHRLILEGFEQTAFVFCNGLFAGMATDGKSTSIFELPTAATEEHELIIILASHSAHSYLECQDMWRMFGLIRPLHLVALPPVHIEQVRLDWRIDWEGERATRAELGLAIAVRNRSGARIAMPTVEGELRSGAGALLHDFIADAATASTRHPEKDIFAPFLGLADGCVGQVYARIRVSGEELELWDPEQPRSYFVVLGIAGCSVHVALRTGCREIGVSGNGELLVNRRPLKLQGVNRHDNHPVRGRAVSRTDMLQDLRLMRWAHANALRTAHYPQQDWLYELADVLGLLVMDEANVETHGLSYQRDLLPGSDPAWLHSSLERARTMQAEHRHHPSIFCWSLGNELGFGENVAQMAALLRTGDPGRLIHKRQMHSVADMDSTTYPAPERMRDYAHEKPWRMYVTNEYAHAMGNAMGEIAAYQQMMDEHPQLAGGFVWEWADHGLLDPQGERAGYYYGGDFDESFHDGNFCMDGIVTPNRELTPKLLELRQIWCAWRCGAAQLDSEGAVLEIRSRMRQPEGLRLGWVLLGNGIELERGTLQLPEFRRMETKGIRLPLDRAALRERAGQRLPAARAVELVLRLDWPRNLAGPETFRPLWTLREVAAPGLETAASCLPQLQPPQLRLPLPDGETTAVYLDTWENPEPAAMPCDPIEAWELELDLEEGCIRRLAPVMDGVAQGGFRDMGVSLFRAPTDNDRRAAYMTGSAMGWQTRGEAEPGPELTWGDCDFARLRPVSVELSLDGTRSTCSSMLRIDSGRSLALDLGYQWSKGAAFQVRLELAFTVAEGLRLSLMGQGSGPLPLLPRFGLVCRTEAAKARWYGLGPGESYADRQSAAQLGIHALTAPACFNGQYVRPQESGLRLGTRWLQLLTEETGEAGLAILGELDFGWQLQPWSAVELDRTAHVQDLPGYKDWRAGRETGASWLYLDIAQLGLGNRSCGPEVAGAYELPPRLRYTNAWLIGSVTKVAGFRAPAQFATSCQERLRFEHPGRNREHYRDPSDPDLYRVL